MSYCTINDLLLELPEEELIKLSGGSSSQINNDKIERCIDFASALIDAYLFGTYKLPLSEPIDLLITKIAVDLSIVMLFENYFAFAAVPNSVVWKKIYAIKMLKDLQNGTIKLQANEMDSGFSTYVRTNKTQGDRIYNKNVLDMLLDF